MCSSLMFLQRGDESVDRCVQILWIRAFPECKWKELLPLTYIRW